MVSPPASRFLNAWVLSAKASSERGVRRGFQAVDALDERHQGLDFTVVLAAEDQIEYLRQHTCTNGISGRCFDLIFAVYRKHFPNPIVKTQDLQGLTPVRPPPVPSTSPVQCECRL